MEGEEFEMDDFNERYAEYDDQTTEDLNNDLNDLSERLLFDNDPLVTERISYINRLLDVRTQETDFGGIEDTRFDGMERASKTLIDIRRFVEKNKGFKINWDTPEGIDLRMRLKTTKGKNVALRVLNENGEFGKDQIVLKRVDGVLELNTGVKVAERAVEQFNRMVDVVVNETRERDEMITDLPMVDKIVSLPRDVFDRLSEQDQRVVNGVLNPSDSMLPESRIGDRGAIQLMIEEFKERSDVIRDTLREHIENRDIVETQKLFEELNDIDTVIDALERQRVNEETRAEQEEDVTRLQRLKKWLKENWLAASAIGITIASLITTIIVGARNVIIKGAGLLKEFAKAVKDALSKLGPWATSLANLVYNIIKAGVGGLGWLSKNIIALVIIIFWFLFTWYSSKK